MPGCQHLDRIFAAYELITGERAMRYAGFEGVFAAASTFGGRWRVTDVDGEPLLALSPVGAPGTDDREVVPHGGAPIATIMRDRRRGDSWVVVDRDHAIMLRATQNGPYELTLTDAQDVLVGRMFATATSVVVEFGTPPSGMHCLALALPLYFTTTGALRVESMEAPAPDLALWGAA